MHRSIAAFILSIALLLGTTATAGAQGPSAGPPPANVRVGLAERRSVRELRLVTGQIEAAKRSTVASEESGRVVISPPPPGTILKKGEVITAVDDDLLKIDIESARTMIDEAQAALAERESQRDTAARTLDRLKELLASNVAQAKEVDDAEDDAAAAASRVALMRALLERSRANLARLERRLEKTKITAPFDGTIVLKSAEIGEWLDPGDPVVEFVATDRLRIRLHVPEQMIEQTPTDEPIDIRVDALDRTVALPVFAKVPDGDTNARTFSVLFYADNADGPLRPGMSVSSHLPTGKSVESMTVPRDAVYVTPTGPVVYAVRGDIAVSVGVIIRFNAGDRFVVDAALRDGDRVVTTGNERLSPGQKVIVTENPAER